MQITPGQIPGTAVEPANATANPVKNERVQAASPAASTVEKAVATTAASLVKPIERATDVSLRRDSSSGRVYYVVSDAHSGQEIIELPPKAVRDAGQGIQDYLKEEESKASSHVKVKA
jgi:uncharacterized FlaG/YvyC family protein